MKRCVLCFRLYLCLDSFTLKTVNEYFFNFYVELKCFVEFLSSFLYTTLLPPVVTTMSRVGLLLMLKLLTISYNANPRFHKSCHFEQEFFIYFTGYITTMTASKNTLFNINCYVFRNDTSI